MDKRKNKYIWAPVTVLVLIVLMVLSARSNIAGGARTILGSVISPVNSAVSFVYEKAGDLTDFLFGSEEMREDYQRLKMENAELKRDLALHEEVFARSDFLENEYQLLKNIDYDYVQAYVNGEAPSNLFGVYTINAGQNKGVEVGDVVVAASKYTDTIYKEGLVGTVSQVGPNFATVRSIYAQDNAVSYINTRTLDKGVINSKGQDGLRGYSFDAEASTKKGDKLLTSGQGGVYPKGLYIGEVLGVNKSDEYEFRIIVEPQVDFSSLYRVMVIDKDVDIDE